MRKTTAWMMGLLGGVAGLVLGWWLGSGLPSVAATGKTENEKLPRYSEEHEAAVLHFVKKNLPDLLPVLEQLKKTSATQYQQEIRELYNDTEVLAELSDDTQRYELELKIWKAENKARLLIAKLSTPNMAVRKKCQDDILKLAKDLVDFDLQGLKLKADQLDKELGEINDEISRMKENKETITKERYETLLNKAQRGKK
jgi:hypothetical protein